MMQYWNNLTDRERWLLVIGGIVSSIFLFYLLVFLPLVDGVHHKTQLLIEKKNTLSFLINAQKQQKTVKKVHVLKQSQLLTVLTEQLTHSSFNQSMYQVQQTASGDIQLSFDAVPFNPLIHWLWAINQQYSLVIKQLHVERTPVSGVVKIVLIIH